MGGLDICYGRYDQQDHPLTDLGVEQNFLFPGTYKPYNIT